MLFGQTVNRLVLDPEDLVRPVASRGEGMIPYLERHLKDLMRTEETTFDSCASQVSHIISKRLGRADLDVHSIAEEIGLSATHAAAPPCRRKGLPCAISSAGTAPMSSTDC